MIHCSCTMAIEEEIPLLDEQGPPGCRPFNHRRDIHIMCVAFLLNFLSYGAVQNLESTINSVGGLGNTSLGILYVSFAFFSVFASLVVRKLKPKKALVLGTTGYWLFIAANLKPSWYTLVPACVYLGFSSSIIWVGQGTYLTASAASHAIDHNLNEVTVIGQFNGQFWGIYATHQVIGNLITLAVLRDEEGGSTSGTMLLLVLFLGIMTVGAFLMCFLSNKSGKEERSQDTPSSLSSSVVRSLRSVFKLLLDKRMVLIIPLMAYSGLQQAFVWAEYTKEIVKPALGERGVGGAMAVFGVFDAISSLTAGRLTSGLKSVTFIVSAGACVQLVVLLWVLLNHSVGGGLLGTLPRLLIGGLWGIGDAVFMTQLSAFHGILFKHDLAGAFSQLKLWQAVCIALVFFMGPSLSLRTMVVIMIAALCIAMAAFLFLTISVEKAFSKNRASLSG